jgi:isopentenyl diphosphate isomerase/L-lactate dehydrogenase-like FMN-dependent dehydrogenase
MEGHVRLARDTEDVVAVVLDFSKQAKIDSQVKSLDAIVHKKWCLTDIKAMKEASGKPVVVKGVMTLEDALSAVLNGADAIWISNNGGRSMDTMPSTIAVLGSIAKAVKKANPKVDIYIDGGIRRGTDVAKCLALGATLVFLGRPVAWGLHFGGKEGL